ncbi:hypothetical protein EPN87_00285 [archaeon]|nr:MAG: hypothetical protein EPN87_00285 [archaeon]
MAYIGEVVGGGRTTKGKAFLVYGVSVENNQNRLIKAVSDSDTVRISPLGGSTTNNYLQLPPLTYNAIQTMNIGGEAFAGNGLHTDDVYHIHDDPSEYASELCKILKGWGAKPDKYNTPRIAAINDRKYRIVLGIVTSKSVSAATFKDTDRSKAILISTYTGNTVTPEPPVFRHFTDITKTIDIEGNTAQELANSLFEVDPNFVCTAAAVYRGVKYSSVLEWEVAVKNLFR